MNPENYPRRLLLCVAGLSPQIVTETLYALAVQHHPAFIPTEVHLLTTSDGAERARLTLLGEEPGWFQRLCHDYGMDSAAIHFDTDTIHLICDTAGESLSDIRSVSDNTAVADTITTLVRKLTSNSDCAIHASIAGGRKTMGFYLGYAMSLLGRSQDRLSHVLVSTPFETNINFFYPSPAPRTIFTNPPDQRPLDASTAKVTLADIPFVRLRDGLQEALLEPNASFTAVVAQAQRDLALPDLTLEPASCRVRCGETMLRLTPISFAWLAWFARRALAGQPPLHWKRIEAAETEDFLSEYKAALSRLPANEKYPVIDNSEFFEQRNSKLKGELRKGLGSSKAAQIYSVQKQGTQRLAGYALELKPHQIHFASLEEEQDGKLAEGDIKY